MMPTIASQEADFEAARCRSVRAMVRCGVAIATLLIVGEAGAFQATQVVPPRPIPPQAAPRLPGAVERLPEGIGPGAPFDVAAFFATSPTDLNAAPQYLVALFEFDAGMSVCFPPNLETARRKQIAERRGRTLDVLYAAFAKDPSSVSDEAIDGLAAEFEEGMRMIAEAQRRPKCVFPTSLDYNHPPPHFPAARRVAWLAVLRARRSLDRGDVEQPLHDLGIVLRLIRDLRPRSGINSQLLASAMTGTCTSRIIPLLLASPAFSEPHARRLLKILVDHESASIDGYREGIEFEYVALRKLLGDVVRDPHGSVPNLVDRILNKKGGRTEKPRAYAQIVRHQIEKMPAQHVNQVLAQVDDVFRDLLELDNQPFCRWPEEPFDVKRFLDGTFYSKIPAIFLPSARSFGEMEARAKVYVRGSECLVALRLWMDSKHPVPTDLEAVVKAAGLPKVPIDPYCGEPLRLAIIDGRPVVYSIDKDGRDDGGKLDSDFGRKPGDQIYRLPAIETAQR